MIEKIIKNVLELPGVDGACILDKKGNLLHNALPDFFLEDFLEDLSRRVTTLYEAVDENYMPCDDYILKFPQKYIQLRRSRHIYLLVAVEPTTNLVSLRMVTNLVLKHITPKILGELRAQLKASANEAAVAAPPPPVAPTPAELSPPPVPPVEASPEPDPTSTHTTTVNGRKRPVRPRPTRSFRGSTY
ncbi:hypothetical protein QEH59_13670 [Coraliomargarita sp. SDUM461004]|uniref:Roadblock/LAMTOR2 domain-containing protein n=1 Tax=Thalassobacterium sedimentorum TaxID=3041258 RepID=A0ABU1AL05_9BACT|nr:hypothetical protein [Coraliomargarita sp. SDUM461004]MDQ8195478.1 hypothetical protein [Coraliomargarita sp. SDUM461004]